MERQKMRFLNRLLGKPQRRASSPEEDERHYKLKKQALEQLLGPMHNLVGHAFIPFQVGGPVDMYYFPQPDGGTAFATMELIEPDGSGPKPSRIGTYELVAFTRLKLTQRESAVTGGTQPPDAFNAIERRMCGIFTILGRYGREAVLNPLETCEVPLREGEPTRCLVFDQYDKPGVEFRIGGKRHGLLLCIEVFRSEMEYAMEHRSGALLDLLKARGHYPYSDLDREPVV